VVNILAFILILTINFISGNVLRIIIGLPFLLFFPGYVLVLAIFPHKGSMGGIQLLSLSVGLSIVLIPLMGLLLNYTPWGLWLGSILYSLFVFIMIISVIAYLRSWRLPITDRWDFSFTLGVPKFRQSRLDWRLSILLIIVILGALATIGYEIATPKAGEKYTEFYSLGINGQAVDYPTDFTLDNGQVVSVEYGSLSTVFKEQYGRLTLGIVNHEGQNANYTVTVQIDGMQVLIPFQGGTVYSIGPMTLKPEEKWEQEIGILPQHTGDDQDVEIFLYKNGDTAPYLNLNFWINVN
jgi:uncharacterized membrane protein